MGGELNKEQIGTNPITNMSPTPLPLPAVTRKVKKITENLNLLNRAAFWLSRDSSNMGLGASSTGLGGSMMNLPDSVAISRSGSEERRSKGGLLSVKCPPADKREIEGEGARAGLGPLLSPSPSTSTSTFLQQPFSPSPLSDRRPVDKETRRRLSRTVAINLNFLTSPLSVSSSPSVAGTPKASPHLLSLPPPLSLHSNLFSPSSSYSYSRSGSSSSSPKARLQHLLRTSSDEGRLPTKLQSSGGKCLNSSEKGQKSRMREDPSRPHNVPPLSLESLPSALGIGSLSTRTHPHSARLSAPLSISCRNSMSSSGLCSLSAPSSISKFTR